jgi:hypothetical protein
MLDLAIGINDVGCLANKKACKYVFTGLFVVFKHIFAVREGFEPSVEL